MFKMKFLMPKEEIDIETLTPAEYEAYDATYFPQVGDTTDDMFTKLELVYDYATQLESESGFYDRSVRGVGTEYKYAGGATNCYCLLNNTILNLIPSKRDISRLEKKYDFMTEVEALNDLMLR